MTLSHESMNTKDTIIAPVTPPGEGGVSIVRLSGPSSYYLLEHYFSPTGSVEKFSSHRLYHGKLKDDNGAIIDEVLAVYMAAPRTYTCDDVVEIHCHGSRHIVRIILDLFQRAGVRLAQPGEFTYRAFLNGRIDLTQAEAVARLIHSSSESSRKLALSQVDGGLSQKIYYFQRAVKKLLVLVEAWIDFPEEDIPGTDIQQIRYGVAALVEEVGRITSTYSYGRILSEGLSVLLVGKPNVGKSSLLNFILGEERAIVTDIPGTTRDIIEEGIVIHDIPVRIFDTAGLRNSDDPVEMEGIRRAQKKISEVDLVLLLVDSSRPLDQADLDALDVCRQYPCVVVKTKGDLDTCHHNYDFSQFTCLSVSAKTGAGIKELINYIYEYFINDPSSVSDSVLLAERRHYESLISSLANLKKALQLIGQDEFLEFIAFELREALFYLGQITGETTTEDLLGEIFSGFCIGK